jgi:phenylpyruvate tautomerase PptA (4-oxalocrotonate tautomerase family)
VPFIEVTAFEHRFTDESKAKRLIAALTDVIADTFGEEVRAETEVVLTGVRPSRWGFGEEVRG